MITILLILLFVIYNTKVIENTSLLTLEQTKILKAVLPITIIIGHISFSHPHTILSDFRYYGDYAVGMFFFISGYGLRYKYTEKAFTRLDLLKRIKKILLPLVFPIIIYGILKYRTEGINLQEVLYSSINDVNLFLPFTWFIIILILQYFLFYIALRIQKSRKGFCISVISLQVIANILLLLKYDSYIYTSNLSFTIGVLAKSYEKEIIEILNKNIIKYILLLLFVIISFSFYKGYPPIKGYALIAVPTYVVCFLGVSYRKMTINKKLEPIFSFFYSISFQMYLCQGITFIIMKNLINLDLFAYIVLFFIINIALSKFVLFLEKKILYLI